MLAFFLTFIKSQSALIYNFFDTAQIYLFGTWFMRMWTIWGRQVVNRNTNDINYIYIVRFFVDGCKICFCTYLFWCCRLEFIKKRKSLIHVLVNDKPQRNIYTEHNMMCLWFWYNINDTKNMFSKFCSLSWYYFGVSFFCVVLLFLVRLLSCK